MLLFYWSFPILASFLFLHTDSKKWNGEDENANVASCAPNPCVPGYACKVDALGALCYKQSRGSFASYNFNIDSNNRFFDHGLLNWILRLIKLFGKILKHRPMSNAKGNDIRMPDTKQTGNEEDIGMPDTEQTGNGDNTGEPDTKETVTEEPVTKETVTEEPVTKETVTEEPVTKETVTEEPVTVEPEESTKMDPCDSSPCQHGGNCTADPTTNAVTCECPFPTGGVNCELDLGGCANCTRKGKLVLFLLNDKRRNFDQALQACHDQGLKMFQPKTNDSYQFAREYMLERQVNGTRPEGFQAQKLYSYWIGLRRENKSEPFKWVEDGDELGTFKDWTRGKPDPGEDNCVNLPSKDSFKFRWDNDKCASTYSALYYYYSTCSGYYDFYDADE